jgi:hypothetical protein
MEIDQDTINALRAYIREVDFAKGRCPDERVRILFMCACMGPKPGCTECGCVLRRKRIDAFLERTKPPSE